MDSYEPHTHSFVVKIWLEEAASGSSPNHWRGHVTHVFTGERRYFQTLVALTTFVEGYLYQMGIQPAQPSSVQWWNKLRRWYCNPKDIENP